jgi:hypothetical protein
MCKRSDSSTTTVASIIRHACFLCIVNVANKSCSCVCLCMMLSNEQDFLRWFDLLNFNIGWSLSLGCVLQTNFYDRLLLITLAPVALAMILVFTYTLASHRAKVTAVTVPSSRRTLEHERTERLNRILSRHQTAFLVMTFLVYSTVSTTVFQTFACDSIEGTGSSYLRADYSTQCGTHEHMLYRLYAAFMILVYPIGIPAVYAYLLWSRRELMKDAATAQQSSSLLASQTSSTFTRSQSVLRRSKSFIVVESCQFLYSAYRPQLYYWELVECGRRILLTGFMCFIYPNTATQPAVACLIAGCSLCIVLSYRPYRDTLDERAYVSGSVIIVLSMFLALMIKANVSTSENDSSEAVYSVLLILMNAAIILVALYQMFTAGRQTIGNISSANISAIWQSRKRFSFQNPLTTAAAARDSSSDTVVRDDAVAPSSTIKQSNGVRNSTEQQHAAAVAIDSSLKPEVV